MTRSLFTMNVQTIALIFYLVVLLHCSSIHASVDERPPVLKDQPLDDVKRFNEKIFIPCEADGETDRHGNLSHEYWWEKDGSNFSEGVHECIPKNSPDCIYGLYIESANKTHEGKYRCFAKNDLGIAMSNTVSLLRAAKPSGEFSTTQSLTVNKGSPFKLSCPMELDDSLLSENNYWQQNQKNAANPYILFKGYTRGVYDPKGNFYFSQAEEADTGSYDYMYFSSTTDATGLAIRPKFNICTIQLRVDPSPSKYNKCEKRYVSNENEPELAVWNQNKTLYCIYDGNCEITWKKNGEVLNSSANQYLDIPNFTSDKEVNYTCEVQETTNQGLLHTHNFIVKIGKPFLKEGPENTDIRIGETAEFHCFVSNSDGNTSIQWFYNAKRIEYCEFATDLKIHSAASILTIENCEGKHSGKYGCLVTNSHGYTYEEAYLYVNKTMLEYSNESSVDTTIQIDVGKTVNWTCPVRAYPSHTIEWEKNDETIFDKSNDSRIVISNGRKLLTIKNFTSADEGKYVCIVSVVGIDPIRFEINFAANPKNEGSSNWIIYCVVGFLLIMVIIAAILMVFKKRGYARRIVYDVRRVERKTANQKHLKTDEKSDVSLLAEHSAGTATLNLRRQSTQNEVTIAQAGCAA